MKVESTRQYFRFITLIISVILMVCFQSSIVYCDQKIFPTGLILEDGETYEYMAVSNFQISNRKLPFSADLSDKFPLPGNQGMQGSCVGWAVAYALKSNQEYIERGWPLSSKSHIFSPAYIYNQIKVPGPRGGSRYSDALRLLKKEGVASWADFPYTPSSDTEIPDIHTKAKAKEYVIEKWEKVDVQNIHNIKSLISAGKPVLVSVRVDNGLHRLSRGQIYRKFSGRTAGYHAMVIVGYDDNKAGGQGAFKLINSWGTGWGDDGFGWFTYKAFQNIARQGFVTHDSQISKPVPKPRPKPQKPKINIVKPKFPHFSHLPYLPSRPDFPSDRDQPMNFKLTGGNSLEISLNGIRNKIYIIRIKGDNGNIGMYKISGNDEDGVFYMNIANKAKVNIKGVGNTLYLSESLQEKVKYNFQGKNNKLGILHD